MIKECKYCHNKFEDRIRKQYCSRKCFNVARRGPYWHTMKCLRCGNEFSQRTDGNPQHTFCSLSCARMGERQNIKVSCTDAFGNWFAGFVDGEGSFLMPIYKTKSGARYGQRFHIGLRIDDAAIVEEIVSTLGFGTTIRQKSCFSKQRNKLDLPQIFFAVDGIDECLALVSLFKKYPLRAKKQRDFKIWAKAVKEKTKGGQANQTLLAQYAKDIREIRKFK